MCGIAGIFDLVGPREIAHARLARMGAALAHRGPDDEGFWQHPGTGLVHRRLEIIDPANGLQPMATPDNDVCLVFNGMIYNFEALRKTLQHAGYVFKTRSDTEVILHGWRHWGIALPHHLDGFFAIGLYDARADSLILMRDRWGKKPLYYTVENNQLLFASDVPAITTAMATQPPIRFDAFSDYISFGYVPEPKSIYEGIHKLPPAHTLQVVRGGQPKLDRYWSIAMDPQDDGQTLDDAAQELNGLIDAAVRKRLVADVPLGAFLSGGLDSAAIVNSMTRQSSQDLHTCTMGFDDAPALDERDLAAVTARRCGTHHISEGIQIDDVLDIDDLVTGFGEPFADPSALPTARVSQLARKHMTVALSGDGGDELFAGYRRYPFHVREEQVKRRIPAPVRAAVFGPLAKLYPRAHWAPRPLRAKATFEALAGDTAQGLLRATCITTDADKAALLSLRSGDDYNSVDLIKQHVLAAQTDDPLARAQYVDLMTWLPGRMLVKVDRASMRHGLEVRNPLLDTDIAQWAVKLPTRLKLQGFNGKRVLRHALAKNVAPEILQAPKRGFTPPIHDWMQGQLRPRLEALPHQDWAKQMLHTPTVERFITEQFSNRVDRKTTLWALLMFDAWWRKFNGL